MGLSRKQIPYLFATFLLTTGGILFFAFPIRNIFNYYIQLASLPGQGYYYLIIPVVAAIYLLFMYFFVMSTFFLTSFTDPGVFPRESTKEEDDFREPLYRAITINGIAVKMKWCETCNFYRPPRTSHCSICDNCVEKFDHHCPWVDNCVGSRNYKYFFLFVNSLSFFILNGFGWTAYSIVLHNENGSDQLVFAILDFVLLLLGVIGFIPVVGLAGFHCGLVCMGRTTNEHITAKYRTTGNPFDVGCRRNCITVLCALHKPRYMNYIMKPYNPNRLEPVTLQGLQGLSTPPPVPIYEDIKAAEESYNATLNGVPARELYPEDAHYADAQMTEIPV